MNPFIFFPVDHPNSLTKNIDVNLVFRNIKLQVIDHVTVTVYDLKFINEFIKEEGYFNAEHALITDELSIKKISETLCSLILNDDISNFELIERVATIDKIEHVYDNKIYYLSEQNLS